MPKTYEDEILPGGDRLRHYLKSDEWGFPQDYGVTRYATRAEAVSLSKVRTERRRVAAIQEGFSTLSWASLESLRRCPECAAVVESSFVLTHSEWHDEQPR